MRRWLIISALLAGCGGGGGSDHQPARVVVAGDSITLRTGQCAPGSSFADCAGLVGGSSYATHLPADSFAVLSNAGRGGDTCLPGPAFEAGLYAGQPRGLISRMDSVLAPRPEAVFVMIGVNDRGIYGTELPAVVQCLESVWSRVRVAGAEPVALTYPPIDAGTLVWGLPHGEGRARAQMLNAATRQAAQARGVRVIDLEPLQGYSTSDGVHPDPNGARLMAAEINRQLR